MAVGAIKNPNMSFEEWLKAEGKTGEVKQPPVRQGQVTENGVPVHLAQELHSGKTIFQVATQNPTKETAGAGGASTFGVSPQPQGISDNAPSNPSNINTDNNSPTVLAAGATGHTAQSQGPTLVSGLQAPQGNENSGASGGSTSKKLNQDLYAQYERAMAEAKVADQGGGVSTGEGTLSTGDVKDTGGANDTGGIGGTSGASGASGTNGLTGAENTSPTDSSNPTNSGNDVPDEVGNKENQNDTSNDTTADINKQEEQRQEEILNSRRFKKFEEENAA